MWLYVPTSCQSAPGPEDSISASDSPAQMLAQSVTWSGKHSRSQTWLQRFKRVSWTMLLSGAILPPSMATRGVERWIGSLAESRVSHTALPDSGKGPTTNGTSGPTLPESSGKSDPASSFWRTFQESQGITTSASGQSYGEWVTTLRRDYSRRKRLAERRSGSACSSWPAPNLPNGGRMAATAERKGNTLYQLDRKVQEGLEWATRVWPAPTTAPEAPNKHTHTKNGPASLAEAALSFWPTALATDGAKAPTKHGNGDLSLPQAARTWPTATVSDAAETFTHGHGDLKLSGAARVFPTASASDAKGFDVPNKAKPSKTWDSYSRLAKMTSKPGHKCSPKCRRLNPLFVEMLMGWPGGWTLLPLGLRDLESLATEWSRWWRLMRSVLSQLG